MTSKSKKIVGIAAVAAAAYFFLVRKGSVGITSFTPVPPKLTSVNLGLRAPTSLSVAAPRIGVSLPLPTTIAPRPLSGLATRYPIGSLAMRYPVGGLATHYGNGSLG